MQIYFMQPDVWQTFSVLSAQYLIVQDLFAATDNPGKSLYSIHHPLTNTVQEPLLHSPSTHQHSTGAFAPLTIHSTTQEPLLHSPFTQQHNARAFVPFIQQHSTRAFTPLNNTLQDPLLHSTTHYRTLCSTQQHITGPFAPLTICATTQDRVQVQCRSLCSTHHSLNNIVQEPLLNSMVQDPLLHSPFM